MSDFLEDLQFERDYLESKLAEVQASLDHAEALLSYTYLLQQMTRAEREQGRLDPQTLLAIDDEIRENPKLRAEDVIRLHADIEDRLRGSGAWWH